MFTSLSTNWDWLNEIRKRNLFGFLRAVSDGHEPMTAVHWLEENAMGFRELCGEERNAIMEFAFLWSLFEAKVLNTHGNGDAIVQVSRRWREKGLLTEQTFERQLAYFQNRYYESGEFSYHFDHLHLRMGDKPDLVRRVLKDEAVDLSEIAAAVLIIVFRYRNNLFHGIKWAYEIQGQLENFNHANAVLIEALELHEITERH